jgi:hypothetical protein
MWDFCVHNYINIPNLPECTEESQDKTQYVLGYREIYLDKMYLRL